MSNVQTLYVLLAVGVMGASVLGEAQTSAPAGAPKPATAHRPASSASPYRVVATVQELMDAIIAPSSKAVFDAVGTEVTDKGAVDKAPKNDEEWTEVRNKAMAMVEASNLLLLPGRHISNQKVDAKTAHDAGELTPPEIEVRVAKARTTWNQRAVGFRTAAMVALKAADARKPADVQAAGEVVDAACENCHLTFWYPDQVQTLEKADQKLLKKK